MATTAKRAHGTDALGRPAGARAAELARRPPPTSHASADDELRSILTPHALAAPEPALRFARWAKEYPCVLRAHQLVLSREASILRRHEELSARRPNSSVKMTSAQLLGRALVEAYCGSFDGPLLPGLDFFDKSICVAPTFCSWVLPPVPPRGVRLAPPPLSYILSCHLVATSPTYNPLSSKAHPHAAVDVFLQVHLIHDSPLVTQPITIYRGVTLHRLAAPIMVDSKLLPAIDARWEAYGQILRRERPADDACVFMIDFSDVRPLRDPSQLCVERPDALMVASDTCRRDGAKLFLRHQLNVSGMRSSRDLQEFIKQGTRDSYVNNAGSRHAGTHTGILGGTYATVFEPFRRWLVSATRAHYRQQPGPAKYVIDAVLLNDAMLHYQRRVYGGFPRGYLNLPMGGDLCLWHPVPYCRFAQYEKCGVRDMLLAMQPNYYFSHKLGCGRYLPC